MMITPRGICQICGALAHSSKSTCQDHIDEIVRRGLAGETMRAIAESLSTDEVFITRNAIIGLFGREKGAVHHPRASAKSVATRQENKAAAKLYVAEMKLARKRSGLHPKDPVGCRWIDDHSNEPDWGYCQRDRQSGSSYCEFHHVKTIKKPRAKAGPGDRRRRNHVAKQQYRKAEAEAVRWR